MRTDVGGAVPTGRKSTGTFPGPLRRFSSGTILGLFWSAVFVLIALSSIVVPLITRRIYVPLGRLALETDWPMTKPVVEPTLTCMPAGLAFKATPVALPAEALPRHTMV